MGTEFMGQIKEDSIVTSFPMLPDMCAVHPNLQCQGISREGSKRYSVQV